MVGLLLLLQLGSIVHLIYVRCRMGGIKMESSSYTNIRFGAILSNGGCQMIGKRWHIPGVIVVYNWRGFEFVLIR